MKQGGGRFSITTALLVMAVIVGGAAMAYLSAISTRDQYRAELTDRAATIATALDSEKVAQLRGEPSDAEMPVYRELQTKLRLLKQSNPDVRSVYLSGIEGERVYFTVDSEVPGTQYYSPPGETYKEATDLYKSVFEGTKPVVEGPLADSYGVWVNGLAPVVDLDSGRVVGVVGIDVDAADYWQAIATSAMVPSLATVVFLVVLVIYEWNRLRQRRELRNRSELMSIASHELRTPITGMRWAAESLLHTQPEGQTRSMVQAMYDSILNLQAGAEDILQLTRLQKNPKMQMAAADLVPLITEICNTQRILAGQKRVVIKMDESWPAAVLVHCDQARIKQVFHNLVSNAVKYTTEGTVVTLTFKQDGKHIYILISDQGIGIPKDEQSRVFEGFYRASNAKEGGESGTGLGLYLVKTIVHQHHGKVSFVSEQNKGTTFTVALPI